MYGWKARLGVMPTMDDMVLEPELNHMAPEGVAIYAERLRKPNNDTNASTQAAALDSLDDCVKTLLWARPQVICIGSTSTSFVKGAKVGRELINRVKEISGGIPGTSISEGLLEAAAAFDVKKVSVVTPYVDDLNVKEKEFLEDNGLEVTNVTGMQLLSSDDICWLKPEQITDFALKHFDSSADSLVLSCTGLHTAPIMDLLERRIGKPVISSNAAALWRMLRIAGVTEKVPGFGRLLVEH
ncbi:MAG TPA: hypothetical protein VEB67_00850 [Nitrososphaerales archaeon]|nr:hypothetical protein [Nitrososphaerales archaeon]